MSKRRKLTANPAPHESDELRLGLPDGGMMSIGFKPLPPGVVSQRLHMTAVYGDKRDWMQGAFDALNAIQGREPHNQLPVSSCRVIAQTAVAPVSFRKVATWERDGSGARQSGIPDAPVITLTPPNASFVKRFSEPDPLLRVDRLFSTAERIRNLVSFSVGMAVPIAVLLSSREFLQYLRMDAPPITGAPREAVEGSQPVADIWYDTFRRGYAEAQRTLEVFPPESPASRTLSLVGESMWTPDPEERFFYCWRALEVIGSLDLDLARKRAQKGDTSAAEPYLRSVSKALLNAQFARIDTPTRVDIAVRSRVKDVPMGIVERLYGLRNAIAHGTVSKEDHLEILKAGPKIFGLAMTAARTLVAT